MVAGSSGGGQHLWEVAVVGEVSGGIPGMLGQPV